MKIAKKYRKCCYCSHYFVNVKWEKLCVDRICVDGVNRIKVRERLGMMGDLHSCEQFEPCDALVAELERKKKERAEDRRRKNEKKG